jgi:hypothetical protein
MEVFLGVTGDPSPDGAPSGPDTAWKPSVGIVAPVKEEQPHLFEWIAYHRALGVESFVLGDNGGADRTSELLQLLDAANVVRRLDWLGAKYFQAQFYIDAIPRLCGAANVCAAIDVDEFLRPLGGHSDIISAIGQIFRHPGTSAAGLSWVTYGSNGRIEPGEGLVIERFTRRGEDDHIRNRVVKSLVRPEQFAGVVNPHVFEITNGAYVNDRGEPIQWADVPAMAVFASWHNLRVDHFVIKSRREFESKSRRGLPGNPIGRDEAFFASRDLNDVFDPMPADFVARTKDEMARLRERLKRIVSQDNHLDVLLGK